MPVIADELWKNPGNPGMIVVTSHAGVEPGGYLPLRDGPAAEAVRRIPGIEEQCGMLVQQCAVDGVFGFLPVRPSQPDQKIIGFGLFQTRVEADASAEPDLIRYSMECLREYAESHAGLKVRMNFPGISTGGLSADQVAPLLLPLPPTITICHSGEISQRMPETGFPGFKSLYLQVEAMLLDGRHQMAVEHLMRSGYDIQSALDQVNAVQRTLRERSIHEADHVRRWRSSRV